MSNEIMKAHEQALVDCLAKLKAANDTLAYASNVRKQQGFDAAYAVEQALKNLQANNQ
jgi:hypothetical protein